MAHANREQPRQDDILVGMIVASLAYSGKQHLPLRDKRSSPVKSSNFKSFPSEALTQDV